MRRSPARRWERRLPLLVATALATIVALAVVYVVVADVGSHRELASQRSKDRAVAKVLVSDVEGGLTQQRLHSMELLLNEEHMRATIVVAGQTTHLGAPLPRDVTLVRARLPLAEGGSVSVVSTVESLPDPPLLVVLLATGALVLVLGVAVGTNVLLTRETRRRVASAVAAAERISSGDLSARVGSEGPEPLGSLGKAFDEMAARLEEAAVEQRALLADLAHEIATPIQALSGFATAVLDGAIAAERARPAIESQTERLSQLLDELAELRTIDDERPPPATRTDLQALVAHLLEELAPMATHVQVQRQLDAVVVETDPALVQTVVRNLLTNAFRFTLPGGQVVVSTRRSGQAAIVSVRDTGPGIAPEHQPHVFDRFYRAEPARDRVRGGSGLGLAIARTAAERVGGHIELSSTPGEGSEFLLSLPMSLAGPRDGDALRAVHETSPGAAATARTGAAELKKS